MECRARRHEPNGFSDARRERAVAQIVLDQPPRVRIERAASRHRLYQMLPEALQLRRAAAVAERAQIALFGYAGALALPRREIEQRGKPLGSPAVHARGIEP